MSSENNRIGNRALVSFLVLPLVFLTVALLGGLRISAEHAFVFVAPPLITLLLAVLLMLLFVRGGLIRFQRWVANDRPPLTNVSHIWMLFTLFFASAQAFNLVLPERGILHWLFSFFLLWTLWNNQFSSFGGTISSHRLTPADSCAALPCFSGLRFSSNTCCSQVFIVRMADG